MKHRLMADHEISPNAFDQNCDFTWCLRFQIYRKCIS